MCLVRVTINIYFILQVEEDVVAEAEVDEERKEVEKSAAVEEEERHKEV